MYKQGRDRLHAPTPILKQMVTAGFKGRKSGRGFYTYVEPGSSKVTDDGAAAHVAGVGASPRPVRRVGVVGSGTMATGIVEVLAKGGYDVVFVARSSDKTATVSAALTRSLEKAVQRGKLSEADRDAALARVAGTTSLDDLGDVDLVVEAVVEDLAVKQALFSNLDDICKPGAVLATTTSSLPVIECAAATRRPADVVGLHFFNPAPVMRLVEVVHTVSTAADVVATAIQVCEQLGRHPVSCADRSGLLVDAAAGSFPAPDGGWHRVPPWRDGVEAVLAFTGHAVLAVGDDVDDGTLAALAPDGFGGAHHPRVVTTLAGAGWVDALDAVLVARGRGGPSSLVERPDLSEHPRAVHARRLRDDVRVLGDADGRGFVTLATGLGGLAEVSVEAWRPGRRHGRALIGAALAEVPCLL